MDGCAYGITLGGDHSIYIRDCQERIYHYSEKTHGWKRFGGTQKVYNLAADHDGRLWIITKEKKVMRWDGEESQWEDMGLTGAQYIAAGAHDQVYALASPGAQNDAQTIYKWTSGNKWI